MKELQLLLVLVIAALIGCKPFDESDTSKENRNLPITAPLKAELKAQPTINDQFAILYDHFEQTLDRSESLTGVDSNQDRIRDDIEAFINALEVIEPVRNALKQNARFAQENLYHDWSEESNANIDKAWKIGDKHNRVIACKNFVGITARDNTNTGMTIEALTYNTKARTKAYLAYNRLQDGRVSTSLQDEEKYCE